METLILENLATELAALTAKYGIDLTAWPMEGHAVIALEIQADPLLRTDPVAAIRDALPLAVYAAQGECVIFADLSADRVLVRKTLVRATL